MSTSNNTVIQLQDVDIVQEQNVILSDVNFIIGQAEFVYLVGDSGAGKSSLMKYLFGVIPHTKGKAQVLDFDLASIPYQEKYKLRRNVSMIFQDFKLFERWTVYKNLLFVLKATDWTDGTAIEQRINEVLEAVDLLKKRERPVYELSGGEQQKLSIARAILNKPQLILADEPTGNLHKDAAESTIRLLFDILQEEKTTIFLTTHHHNILTKFPGRKLLCEEGTISE